MHVTATLFSLDIFVDILDVRYHGVLARRELVTLQLLLLLNRQLLQLGVDRSLLLVGQFLQQHHPVLHTRAQHSTLEHTALHLVQMCPTGQTKNIKMSAGPQLELTLQL